MFLSSSSCSTTAVLIEIFENAVTGLQSKTPYLVLYTALEHNLAAQLSSKFKISEKHCTMCCKTAYIAWQSFLQYKCSPNYAADMLLHYVFLFKSYAAHLQYYWSCTDSVLGFLTASVLHISSSVLQFRKEREREREREREERESWANAEREREREKERESTHVEGVRLTA